MKYPYLFILLISSYTIAYPIPHTHLTRRNVWFNGVATSTTWTFGNNITSFFSNTLGFAKPRAEQEARMAKEREGIVKQWEKVGLDEDGKVKDAGKVLEAYEQWKEEQEELKRVEKEAREKKNKEKKER